MTRHSHLRTVIRAVPAVTRLLPAALLAAALLAGCVPDPDSEPGTTTTTTPGETTTTSVPGTTTTTTTPVGLPASVAVTGVGGAVPDGVAYQPSLSDDGRLVAFVSTSTNLVAGDTNQVSDVFVYDRVTATSRRVSVRSNGEQVAPSAGAAEVLRAMVSGDGRVVAFSSGAPDLVAGDTNGVADVFVHTLATGATVRVSTGTGSAQANGKSVPSSISADGTKVMFVSSATNLVAGDTNGVDDLFVVDVSSGAVTRESVAANGAQADGPTFDGRLTADGRTSLLVSRASNLVGNDRGAGSDVFLRNRSTGAISCVTVDPSGLCVDATAVGAVISDDQRYVGYTTEYPMVSGQSVGGWYLLDRTTGVHHLPPGPASGALVGSPAGSMSGNGSRLVGYDATTASPGVWDQPSRRWIPVPGAQSAITLLLGAAGGLGISRNGAVVAVLTAVGTNGSTLTVAEPSRLG